MAGYLLRRLLSALAVLLLTTVLLALAVHLVPGDPARIVLGEHATPELIAMVRDRMGLDDPIALQVWHFVSGAVQGDLGPDFVQSVPVTSLIGQMPGASEEPSLRRWPAPWAQNRPDPRA